MNDGKREIDEQDASELPDREAMSLIDPGRLVGTMPPMPAPGPATTDGGAPLPADQLNTKLGKL